MPWSLSKREGKWCVIKDSDGSEAGCHVSRTDAIKQQRALYANEARVAAMYAELDERTEEFVDPPAVPGVEVKASSELVRIEIGKEHDNLIASLSDRMDAMTQSQTETQRALVAALQQIGMRENVVNVEAPNVNVEPPSVTIQPAAVTVEAPDVHLPDVHVAAPNVTINPEIHMPEAEPITKTVTFERDPLTGQVSKAEVSES